MIFKKTNNKDNKAIAKAVSSLIRQYFYYRRRVEAGKHTTFKKSEGYYVAKTKALALEKKLYRLTTIPTRKWIELYRLYKPCELIGYLLS